MPPPNSRGIYLWMALLVAAPAAADAQYLFSPQTTSSYSFGGLLEEPGSLVYSLKQRRVATPSLSVLSAAVSAGTGTNVAINLFDDANIVVAFRSYSYTQAPADRTTDSHPVWTGAVLLPEEYPSTPLPTGTAWFVYEGTDLWGEVQYKGRHFRIAPLSDQSGDVMIWENDPSSVPTVPSCGSGGEASPPTLNVPDLTDLYPLSTAIRILVVFTNKTSSTVTHETKLCDLPPPPMEPNCSNLTWTSVQMNTTVEVEGAIATMNDNLCRQYYYREAGVQNSTALPNGWTCGTPPLELVGPIDSDYVENGGYHDFNVLTNGNLNQDFRALRKEHAADLLSLYIDSSPDVCGIASRGYAWSVTARTATLGDLTEDCRAGMTIHHEVGHNLGASHDEYARSDRGTPNVRGAYTAKMLDEPPFKHIYSDVMSYTEDGCAQLTPPDEPGFVNCHTSALYSSKFVSIPFNGWWFPLGDATRDNTGWMLSKHAFLAGLCPAPSNPPGECN